MASLADKGHDNEDNENDHNLNLPDDHDNKQEEEKVENKNNINSGGKFSFYCPRPDPQTFRAKNEGSYLG